MNYKTLGIVVKRTNFSEGDRILTIFTERFGKVKAIARGVRKIKSKLAGSLEPFILLDLQLHEGKTFYTVTGATIAQNFPTLHTDLNKIAKAFYIGELIDKFLAEGQKNNQAFEILIETLRCLERGNDELSLRIFELKLIESCGFSPELFNCVHCKEKLTPKDNYWDNVEGGVICQSCHLCYGHGQSASDNVIKALRMIEEEDLGLIAKFNPSRSLQKELSEVLSDYIESILERELKSKKFLKEITV